MKMKSNSKNARILAANGKVVRHEHITYKIRAHKVGPILLADVEPVVGADGKAVKEAQPINLFGQTKLTKAIRNLVETGIVS